MRRESWSSVPLKVDLKTRQRGAGGGKRSWGVGKFGFDGEGERANLMKGMSMRGGELGAS